MENLPSILTPDLGLLVWMLLAFGIVFALLAKFGFPAITKMVESRKSYIDLSLKSAREATERLANIQAESEALVAQAREKQAAILKDAKATSDAIVADAHAKAKSETERMITEAKMLIDNEKQAAIRDIKAQVAKLSVEIAEKVLREDLKTDSAQMAFIDRLLDEVKV